MAVSNDVPFEPFVSAETLMACALVGLDFLAAEGEAGSSGSQSSDSGDMRAGLVKRGGGAISQGLGAWEGGLELPHDHGPSLTRNEGRVLGYLRVAGFPLFTLLAVSERFSCLGAWKVNCHSRQKPFSHRGWAVTIKERDVVRENKEIKKKKECERQAEVSKKLFAHLF